MIHNIIMIMSTRTFGIHHLHNHQSNVNSGVYMINYDKTTYVKGLPLQGDMVV